MELLNGKHHACPVCGGENRFRFCDFEGDGGVICTGGGIDHIRTGDGIGSVMEISGVNFLEAIKTITKHLGIQEHARGRSVQLKGDHSYLIREWSEKQKPGTTVEAIDRNGGQMFDVLDQGKDVQCICFPVHNGERRSGWVQYPLNGTPLHTAEGDEIKGAKLKFRSSAGWIGMRAIELLKKHNKDVEVVFKCEGTTDMLAIDSLLDSNKYVAITNHAGAGSVLPREQLELFRGKKVVIVADNDMAGRNGAKKWARALMGIAAKIIILIMPGDKEDARQWVSRQEGGLIVVRKALFKMVRTAKEFNYDAENTVEVAAGTSDISITLDPKTVDALATAYCKLNHFIIRDKTIYLRQKDLWMPISIEKLKGRILEFLRHEAFRIWVDGDKDKKENKRIDIIPRLIDDIAKMVMSYRQAPSELDFSCVTKYTRSYRPIECDGVRRDWLTMKNGILMLDAYRAKQAVIIKKPTSDWFSLVRLDFSFVEAHGHKERAFFLDFLARQIGDQEQIDALQEFMGYMLTQDLKIHQQTFLYIQGVANSGKSTLLAILQALCGEGGYSSVGIEKFDDHAFMAETIGKMANITSETRRLSKLDENLIKAFVSGEPMPFRNLYERAFTARPTAKLVISSNFEPEFKDRSDGIWRRMLFIKMDRKIPDDEDKPGFTNPKHWIESGQMPAILNWALAGLERVYERGKIVRPQASIKAIQEQKIQSHVELQFFEDHLERAEGAVVFARQLQETYNSWCKHNNAKPSGAGWLGRRLNDTYGAIKRREPGGTRQWYYEGIRLLKADYAPLQS